MFQPEQLKMLRPRPYKGNTRIRQRSRKRCVLGEKAIARMNRLRAGPAAGRDDRPDTKIALGRAPGTDTDMFIGFKHRFRKAVGIGVYRDGLNPHPAQRILNADGDLAAVCDQHFLENVTPPQRPRPVPGLEWD